MRIAPDDLHNADQALLMMLRFVARQIAGARIVVVAPAPPGFNRYFQVRTGAG
jgi:hypothetical protein